jgi:succinate dehydrogenase/fumarate reductase flavoprotein subunit
MQSSPVDVASGSGVDADGIRDLMWRSAGLFRSRAGLQEAVSRLSLTYDLDAAIVRSGPPDGEAWRRLNLAAVAMLIARAALRREESRGGHFRTDYPRRDDANWNFHAIDLRGPESGTTKSTKES